MGDRTVGAIAARALMDFAVSKGVPLAALVERSGIEPAELRDVENRIVFPKYVALMKTAKAACNDPAFGLHFGESEWGAEASFACMMGLFSPTIAETFTHLKRDAVPDFDPGGSGERYRMTRDGDELRIVDTQEDDFPEGAESSFARTVCTARRVFPEAEFIRAVHFAHAEPPYRAEYDRIFRMPIFFGCRRNGMVTDAAWLDRKPTVPSPEVLESMRARAETLLHHRETAHCTRGRVEALLANLLHTADVSIDAVAGELGMGRHTLLRRLKAEGVTFKQVLDELRRKLAVQYLSERRLAVNETAYLLGFSDPAAFSRAYKRWTGHSPRRAG
jgi:AraC-like DNA-binding protein